MNGCSACKQVVLDRYTCVRCGEKKRAGKNKLCLMCLFKGIQDGDIDLPASSIDDQELPDGSDFDLKITTGARAVSNFFRVKNPDSFRVFCEKWGADVKSGPGHKCPDHQLYGFECPDGIPVYYDVDSEGNGLGGGEFLNELARELEDGTVAVIQQIMWNMGHYMAYSTAVNSKGEEVSLDLDDIYEKAAHLGTFDSRDQEFFIVDELREVGL